MTKKNDQPSQNTIWFGNTLPGTQATEVNQSSQEENHALYDFMRQLSDKMAANYNFIQKRASEDPGTAGDQGEENWAELLRGWLPRTYEVVTKGRIIGQDGKVSPQVDVLVLKSIYPKQLIDENQKIHLAAGVAAAFECKTTLKAEHIEKVVKTCVEIKKLYPDREGTPYKELHSPIVYGLLAHSHSWKHVGSTPDMNVLEKLHYVNQSHVLHPRQYLDLLCVADLGTWPLGKCTFNSSNVFRQIGLESPFETGAAFSYYNRYTTSLNQTEGFTPIGVFISSLSEKLAWENPELRDLVNYYKGVKIGGSGYGHGIPWSSSIYSEKVRQRLEAGYKGLDNNWDEWHLFFH